MEKVKNVVEYMGPDLREDELQRMWKLQDAGNSHTVENLHAVLAGAVSRLSPKHIQCLTSLIHKVGVLMVFNDHPNYNGINTMSSVGSSAL